MKKLLGIVVLGLLWCNVSFADQSELNIEIKKTAQETEPIKINEEYSMNCVVDNGEVNFELNQKVIKSNLKSEATMKFVQTLLLTKDSNVPPISRRFANLREAKQVVIENVDFIKFGTPSTLLNSLASYAVIPLLALLFDPIKIGLFVSGQSPALIS